MTLLTIRKKFTFHLRRSLLLCLSLIVLGGYVSAQSIDISGTIVNEKGEPVPGATIKQVEGTASTATDNEGNFRIKVPLRSKLQISSVGYKAQEITVETVRALKITLAEDVTSMNDIVVVGYGSVKRRDLTGSVGSVKMADFERAPVRSFDEALAGRVAGVQVTSQDGQPGSPVNIVIRGANSLTQDNSPLYVIDGFPIENPENNAINPADIASIDILKDASATAIYGARGANGVVVITTKRGRMGKPVVAYSGFYGINEITKRMDVLNPYEFVKLQKEINPTRTDTTYLKTRTLDDYRNIKGLSFQDLIFATRATQSHSVSLSGGNADTKYSLSANALNQDGIIINTGYRRYQGKFTLDQRISKAVRLGASLSYANMIQKGSSPSINGATSATYLLYGALGYRPVGYNNDEFDIENDLFDPAINTATDLRSNPYVSMQNEIRNNTTENIFINTFLTYQIIPSLMLKVTGGFTRNSLSAQAFNNSKTRSGASILGPNGSFRNDKSFDWLNENTLTYTKQAKGHRFDIMAGMTVSGRSFDSKGASVVGVPNESLGLRGLDEGTPTAVVSGSSKSYLLSYYSRANYSYKSRYLLTATLRADGSSRFSPENRWGYFPSMAAAWRINEEKWLKWVKPLSNLKLRASYGITGNNRVTDFAYYSSLGFPIAASYSFNNATPNNGTYVNSLSNRDLKWESTKELDLGIDIGFFNQRIELAVDFYRKNTSDLLLNAQLPPTTGFGTAFKNIGEVQNRGLEFSLNTVNVSTGNFKWSTGFNIAFNSNKVLGLTQNQEFILTNVTWDQNYNNIPLYKAIIGSPIAQLYGLKFDGLYQLSDFDIETVGGVTTYALKDGIAGNGNSRTAIRPGDNKYTDLNGDGTINQNDYTIIGNPTPKFIGGFVNSFEYKGFDLSVFLQFCYGNDVYNANRLIFETPKSLTGNLNYFEVVANRWTSDAPNTEISKLDGQGIVSYNDRFVEDGSFLRLKTISLGYTFDKAICKKIGFQNIKLFASAQNLLTITNYNGYDPEVSVRNSALTPGFDYSSYPRPRTITFGINVSL